MPTDEEERDEIEQAEFEFPLFFLLQDNRLLVQPIDGKHFLPMWTDEDSVNTFIERRNYSGEAKSLKVTSHVEVARVFHNVGEVAGIVVDPTERDMLTTYRIDQLRWLFPK
jgi:hypothetical protein